MPTTTPARPSFKALSAALGKDPQSILDWFGVDYHPANRGWSCACPVHGGDNPSGFVLFDDGNWRCWTAQCHKHYGWDALGLVRALLTVRDGTERRLTDAVVWAKGRLGNVPVDEPDDGFARRWGRPVEEKKRVTLASVLERLDVPSPYFTGRGFSPATLSLFSVGEPKSPPPPGHPLHDRAVAPVMVGQDVVGYTCRLRREPRGAEPKWYHCGPTGRDPLKTGDVLYGLGQAEPFIAAARSVVLVEGPADVWALNEAGVRNVVGLFGTSLSLGQQALLEKSPADLVFLGQDNDKAGDEGAAQSDAALRSIFNTRRVRPPLKDWAESDRHTIGGYFGS